MLKNDKEGQFSEEPVNSVFAGRAILAITFTQWFQKLWRTYFHLGLFYLIVRNAMLQALCFVVHTF